MAPPKDTAAVTTYGDYELITPQNKLRKALSDRPADPNDDPVARAERALAELSGEFSGWMDEECERLDQARHAVKTVGFTNAAKEQLFHAAHDIKGEAATFGFPACAAAADSLCRLIEYAPDATKIPIKLVDQHVDTVRAIIREYTRSNAMELAAQLNKRLREVTDEFLLHENRNRPDVIQSILGPSIVPNQ
jgi:HPt (histidine-containing phosphotransfer) domain-containing protein